MSSEAKKATYRQICAREPSIPLFARDWWLDALCGPENWGVALAELDGRVAGALPFRIRRRFGFTELGQPPLTQALGPWIRARALGPAKLGSYQKQVLTALIDDLPPFDIYRQSWHHDVANWLPFYWRGFRQTTFYTYLLNDPEKEELAWERLRKNTRREICKATNQFGIKIRNDLGIHAFLDLHRKTFSRQGLAMPYSGELVIRLDEACGARNCRAILIGEDADGRHHAAVYLVWDDHSVYYLMGGSDPDLRSSGAFSLCTWAAIRHAGAIARQFDFEGSMIEPIERFFAGFGAIQTPYFHVEKSNSLLAHIAQHGARYLAAAFRR